MEEEGETEKEHSSGVKEEKKVEERDTVLQL